LPKTPEKLDRLVDYHDRKQSLNDRARAYLHSNCSHCHRKWGGGNAEFQLLSTLKLDETGPSTSNRARHVRRQGRAAAGAGRSGTFAVVAALKRRGLGQMPHIASNVVDPEAVELIEE